MAKTTLEIQVGEEIFVSDELEKVIEFLIEEFKKWVNSDQTTEFAPRIRLVNNNSPPTLEIKVSENVKTKAAFG